MATVMHLAGRERRLLIFLLVFFSQAFSQDAKVMLLAQAIAKAEGFGTRGALPTRYHNPGDLKVAAIGQTYPGQCGVGKGSHVRFCSDRAGWMALYHQLEIIAAGESKHYKPDMTLAQLAKKYAGDWRHWAKNVARNLNVPITTTLAECFELSPVRLNHLRLAYPNDGSSTFTSSIVSECPTYDKCAPTANSRGFDIRSDSSIVIAVSFRRSSSQPIFAHPLQDELEAPWLRDHYPHPSRARPERIPPQLDPYLDPSSNASWNWFGPLPTHQD